MLHLDPRVFIEYAAAPALARRFEQVFMRKADMPKDNHLIQPSMDKWSLSESCFNHPLKRA